MKFSFGNKSNVEQSLDIVIPSKEIEEKVSAKLLSAQKDAKIKGFRKGKAPLDVVTKMYGPEIRQDVVYDSVSHKFQHLVEDKGLKIVSRPNLIPESMEPDKDVKFKATFEVYPEVKMSSLGRLNYTKSNCSIHLAGGSRMSATCQSTEDSGNLSLHQLIHCSEISNAVT